MSCSLFPRLLLLLSTSLALPAFAALDTLSLDGPWRLRLGGPEQALEAAELPAGLLLEDSIQLPGTTESRDKGPLNTEQRLSGLTQIRRFEGQAWFEREITIPSSWSGRTVALFLERTKHCRVWLDGRFVGSSPLLCTPQIQTLGKLTPGKHRLTLLIDNRLKPAPGDNHQISEHTQGNWNGIIGRIELQATGDNAIDWLRVTPSRTDRRISLQLALRGSVPASASIKVIVSPKESPSKVLAQTTESLHLNADGSSLPVSLSLPSAADWDEFSKKLYSVRVELLTPTLSDCARADFGFVSFKAEGTHFQVNNRITFLRGKHDACVFPQTGHPPMSTEEWLAYLRICLSYGINHLRFHSWTPPEAAFEAADQLGIYLQPELPFWGTFKDETATALTPEAKAILRRYGSHPSFVMFSLGNENRGSREVMARLVSELRAISPDKLFAQGSNNYHWIPQLATGDDYWTTSRVPNPNGAKNSYVNVRASFSTNDRDDGLLQTGPANSLGDYSASLKGIPLPVIAHEIGQYTVAPDFSEIPRYTGPFRARNLEAFHDTMRKVGLDGFARDYFNASAKFTALLYREELELALRTPELAGFQVLDLQDFPGQGTALVGILNAFMESKGAISPAAWREFCAPRTLLARLPAYTFRGGDSFRAEIELANYGNSDTQANQLRWRLEDFAGNRLLFGTMPVTPARQGGLRRLGQLSFTLPSLTKAVRAELILELRKDGIQTRYPLWIYPSRLPSLASPSNKPWITHKLDETSLSHLKEGGRVLLYADNQHPFANQVGGGFTTDFWCWPMFRNSPGTLGIFCQPSHPSLDRFPTEFHSNWQWFHLLKQSQPLILDGQPADLKPIIHVIDNFERMHRLGLLLECRVGKGSLLVCATDLPALGAMPEARQLAYSLEQYVASQAFAPAVTLGEQALSALLRTRVSWSDASLTASSSKPNRAPARAFDSNEGNAWEPRSDEAGEYLEINYPMPRTFTSIELDFLHPAPGLSYVLEGSLDGTKWSLLADRSKGCSESGKVHVIGCTTGAWKSVRIRFTKKAPFQGAFGIAEFKLLE